MKLFKQEKIDIALTEKLRMQRTEERKEQLKRACWCEVGNLFRLRGVSEELDDVRITLGEGLESLWLKLERAQIPLQLFHLARLNCRGNQEQVSICQVVSNAIDVNLAGFALHDLAEELDAPPILPKQGPLTFN